MTTMQMPGDPWQTMPTPTFGRSGIFGKRPTFNIPDEINQAAAMSAPRQKFFGKGLFGNVLGGVGDLLLQNAGFESQFAPQQQMRQRLSLMEQQRQQDMADWQAKQEYERANPKPAAPNDTERDYQFIAQTAGQKAADMWLKNRYDPIVTVDEVQNGATLRSFRPRSELTGEAVGSAPAPVANRPPREEYGRFVSTLPPAMQGRAWQAYESGQIDSIPMGSPVGAPVPRARPTFVTRPAPVKDPVKPRMSTLKIGTVIGDKEYIGGNPKNPSSWRKK